MGVQAIAVDGELLTCGLLGPAMDVLLVLWVPALVLLPVVLGCV